MDENYAAKTRHTRQLLGELNRISGAGAGYEAFSIPATKSNVANDVNETNEYMRVLRSNTIPESFYRTKSKSALIKSKTSIYNELSTQKSTSKTGYLSEENLRNKYPESLQQLRYLNALFIVQELETLELKDETDADVRYVVQSMDGDRLFFAIEQSSIIAKLCLCSRRPFTLLVFDNNNEHIMNINRPYRAYFETAKVYAPPDICIGTIEQKFTGMGSLFVVKDASGEIVQKLKSPLCSFLKCGELNYRILSYDSKMNIGLISSEWEGLDAELPINSQYLGVVFPRDLDCHIKTLLLSATLLLSVMLYGD